MMATRFGFSGWVMTMAPLIFVPPLFACFKTQRATQSLPRNKTTSTVVNEGGSDVEPVRSDLA